MNTNQLFSFLTLAETGSYQKAAGPLHYSRSTVMEHIRSLEEELGVKLFASSGRSLMLTPAGSQFQIHAKAMAAAYQQAISDALNFSSSRNLRVLTPETLGLYFLSSVLSDLLSKYPQINLSIQFSAHNGFQDKLRLGEADVAFVFSSRRSSTLPPSEYKQIPICREQIVFFANPYTRLARKKDLCLADLAEANLILTNKDGIYSEWLTRLCKRAGLRISPCQYIDSGSLLKQFVMKHDCISLISKRVIEQELLNGTLVELPLTNQAMYADVVAVIPSNAEENLALEELIRTAIAHLSN